VNPKRHILFFVSNSAANDRYGAKIATKRKTDSIIAFPIIKRTD
jgi:hypothetical protein